MNTDTVLSIGLLILAYALVSGRVKRGIVTPAMVFLGAGLVLGPHVLDIISPQIDTHGVQAVFLGLAELTLTIMLFLQGSRLDVRKIFGRTTRKTMYGRSLATVGVLISIVLGTGLALLVFPDFPFWEAAIVAILVVPTEALVESVIEDRRVPATVREALSLENGLSDGLCLGLLLIAIAFASEHTEGDASHWVSLATKGVGMSLIIGAVMGLAGGKLLELADRAGWTTQIWSELYMLALAVVTFTAVEHLDGSGFVGAFGAGLAFGVVFTGASERPIGAADAIKEGLELVVFVVFGAVVVYPAFDGLDGEVLLYALLSLFVVRMASVFISMARTGFSRATKIYMGWFGPRGLASLILGFIVLEEGDLGHLDTMTDVVVVTVTLSIVLHGLTGRWGVDLYARAIERLRKDKPDAPELGSAEGEPNAPEPAVAAGGTG